MSTKPPTNCARWLAIRTDEGRRIRSGFVVGPGYESLLTADYSFLNEALARVYGISGVSGTDLRKVPYDPENDFTPIASISSRTRITSPRDQRPFSFCSTTLTLRVIA